MGMDKLETKRWLIAGAAMIMQLCLGTVYAWSVFKKPLMTAHGWSETATQATFMIMMAVVGTSAVVGGTLVDKKGPRFVATIGGILFGIGTILTGLADQMGSLPLLYLSYGVIGAVGNGFGYVTPIATLIRWFPDKRGLVSGLAVMGFGAGAFFMGQIAPKMVITLGLAQTFYIWGAIFLVVVTAAAQLYKNPPAGWLPAGFKPQAAKGGGMAESIPFNVAIRTRKWWTLWGMLFLNVSAGLGLISQLSPMAQDVIRSSFQGTPTPAQLKDIALQAGTVLAIASIFNGLGRLGWSWTSDAIGRKAVFAIMFMSQAVLYILLPKIDNIVLFSGIACYLLACYGGGFATMPAFAADTFGAGHIGRVYGTMLTAWGCAGIAGPLVFARVKEATQNYETALFIAAGLLIVGFILTITYKIEWP
jgi:OFA family oxalate/formate antiporter-like MFS transporter